MYSSRSVTFTWKNSTTVKDPQAYNKLLAFLNVQFSNAGVRKRYGGEVQLPVTVYSMRSGVYLNGCTKPWKPGCACLYMDEHTNKIHIGVVDGIFCISEEYRDIVVFSVARHTISANEVRGTAIMFTVTSLFFFFFKEGRFIFQGENAQGTQTPSG